MDLYIKIEINNLYLLFFISIVIVVFLLEGRVSCIYFSPQMINVQFCLLLTPLCLYWFRAKKLGYITTDMIDEYDPALMFTIPRLAIVW